MSWFKPNPEKDLQQLTDGLKTALTDQLKSVVLFGSLARGNFEHGRSNVNVLIVADLSKESLLKMISTVRTWLKKGHILPILVAPDELSRFSRAFPIEFLDLHDHRRVLYGADPLAGLTVDKTHLRAQYEHDLSLLELRVRQAVAGNQLKGLAAAAASSLSALKRAGERLDQTASESDRIKAIESLLNSSHTN